MAAETFGRSPMKVPFLPPLSCGGGTAAREPPPFPRRLSCRRGGRRPRLGVYVYFDLSVLIVGLL